MPTPWPQGSIWDSLRIWDAESPAVLEGFQVNFDALIDQWTVPAHQPALPADEPDHPFGNSITYMNFLILVRSLRLTPDLVRHGLCENLDALSLEQTEALCGTVAAELAESGGLLHAYVHRNGIEALDNTPAAVLWAVSIIPMWQHLARFAKARHTLPESAAITLHAANELEALAADLGSSRPLRTVLQACLVVGNVLSQQGGARLRVDVLPGLRLRRLHANAPSLLRLIACDLQATHERRCRLRFLRMKAVGAVPIMSHAKKLVWQYLDDLHESPWDAVGLLKRCAKWDFKSHVDDLQSERRSCLQLLSSIQAYQRLAAPGAMPNIEKQVENLATSSQEAADDMQDCEQRLGVTASSLLDLFGGSARSGVFDVATEVLRDLGSFGKYLEIEMNSIARMRKHRSLAQWQRGARWGTWEPVVTDDIVLQKTQDPDIVRLLRNPLSGDALSAVNAGSDALRVRADREAQRQTPEQKHAQLLHGGPDGEYRRCELTGRWLPIGYAAAVAERDYGERGATAGFFSTY
jgi:hypothetical protein